jgi:hypothetical protein
MELRCETTARAFTEAKVSLGGLRRDDRDLETEGLDLTGEDACVALGIVAAKEPVGSQICVGGAAVEDVVGGDEDRVLDGDRRLRARRCRTMPARRLRRTSWAHVRPARHGRQLFGTEPYVRPRSGYS